MKQNINITKTRKFRKYIRYLSYFVISFVFMFVVVWLLGIIADNSGTGGKTPLRELLLGYEEEGFVYYPITHRNYFFLIISVVLFSLSLAAILYFIVKRKSTEIKLINEKLFDKNKKIIDSINYAQKIQKNLLPNQVEMRETFKNNFIFYSPKDIVSGDIYWVKKTGRLVYAAVIDCTGHGVPGAFLTILANKAINRLVGQNNSPQPKDILMALSIEFSELNNNQAEYAAADGMDISICCFNEETMELSFAGAMSHMILFTNGKCQIVRGGKAPIGELKRINAKLNPYCDEVFKLSKGDSFYLYSDGYIDQFGGSDRKRLGRVRFMKLLEEINSKNTNEQLILAKNFFHNWKGSEIQTDDVTLLGIKID